MQVEGDGRAFRALGLAPLAVLPGISAAGIGGGLIRKALARARRLGEELVFVLGAPAYYGASASGRDRGAVRLALCRASSDGAEPRRSRCGAGPGRFAGLQRF